MASLSFCGRPGRWSAWARAGRTGEVLSDNWQFQELEFWLWAGALCSSFGPGLKPRLFKNRGALWGFFPSLIGPCLFSITDVTFRLGNCRGIISPHGFLFLCPSFIFWFCFRAVCWGSGILPARGRNLARSLAP